MDMFNKILYIIKRNSGRGKCNLKQERGFTLVEVVVAMVIISIISLALVSGTTTAVNVLKANRAKTLSAAVASEKLELIKCLSYEDIAITGTPVWDAWEAAHPELFNNDYTIDYDITWVDGVDSYMQVEISVSKEPMGSPVIVISQIYPPKGSGGEIDEHPPPEDLTIEYDLGSGGDREIRLVWEAPDTEELEIEVDLYNVYRDDIFLGFASKGFEFYTDQPGDDDVYSYYVTAVYDDDDGVESDPSNEVTTGTEIEYNPPQNLAIAGYENSGSERIVHLDWEAPDTELTVVEYAVYRDGVEIDRTADIIYQDQIGEVNYTYYVTAVYEGGIESDPSNEEVTTGTEIEYNPPQNLQITGYTGSRNSREVNLSWEAPDTELTVVEYVVYRDGVEIDRTPDTIFQNRIRKKNYTFYVTAIYEGDIESDPSNEVTTIPE